MKSTEGKIKEGRNFFSRISKKYQSAGVLEKGKQREETDSSRIVFFKRGKEGEVLTGGGERR